MVFEVLKFIPALQVRGNIEVEIQGLVCRDDDLGRTISSTRPITTPVNAYILLPKFIGIQNLVLPVLDVHAEDAVRLALDLLLPLCPARQAWGLVPER